MKCSCGATATKLSLLNNNPDDKRKENRGWMCDKCFREYDAGSQEPRREITPPGQGELFGG